MGVCPGVVSCADILAFAACESMKLSQGPDGPMPAGCRDGRVSRVMTSLQRQALSKSDNYQIVLSGNYLSCRVRVPVGSSALLSRKERYAEILKLIFSKLPYFKDKVLICSIDVHTIGGTACHHIDDRTYIYLNESKVHPIIPADFVTEFKGQCPKLGLRRRNGHDRITGFKFLPQYYHDFVYKGVLASDQLSWTDRTPRPLVVQNFRIESGRSCLPTLHRQ